MAITSQNRVSDGIKHYATGAFLDTGTVKKSILNLGFKPRYFKIWDLSATEAAYEVVEGMAAGFGYKVAANGDSTFETSGMPSLVENFDSGVVDTWTVYETELYNVGTPAVAPAVKTDNSRLNRASEKFTGVSIPAALIATSVQARWVAWA